MVALRESRSFSVSGTVKCVWKEGKRQRDSESVAWLRSTDNINLSLSRSFALTDAHAQNRKLKRERSWFREHKKAQTQSLERLKKTTKHNYTISGNNFDIKGKPWINQWKKSFEWLVGHSCEEILLLVWASRLTSMLCLRMWHRNTVELH